MTRKKIQLLFSLKLIVWVSLYYIAAVLTQTFLLMITRLFQENNETETNKQTFLISYLVHREVNFKEFISVILYVCKIYLKLVLTFEWKDG